MCAVTMHLKKTAARHAVSFINYGIYDRRTGLLYNEIHRGQSKLFQMKSIRTSHPSASPENLI